MLNWYYINTLITLLSIGRNKKMTLVYNCIDKTEYNHKKHQGIQSSVSLTMRFNVTENIIFRWHSKDNHKI